MRSKILAAGLALACLGALGACDNTPPKTALGYTENAKRAYDAAMQDFDAHQWLEAQAAMREVKRKYSYSKYARLAELRIADADYAQEKFAEAIHEYKEFVRAHRSDDEGVAYARGRVAEATYAEIPESILMPAAEERDQAAVLDAYNEIRSFLTDYPTAKESPHLRDLLGQSIGRLIRHELYVARFYLGKSNYEAAVARIKYALEHYPEKSEGPSTSSAQTSLSAEALLLLGETYLKMRKWTDARGAFEAIVSLHGLTAEATQARNYLNHLKELGV